MNALRHSCVLMLLMFGFAASLPASVSVTGYELLSETRVSRTAFEYEYRVFATNAGAQPVFHVEAIASSQSPAFTIMQGKAEFSRINAGQSAPSTNTIRFRFDRRTAWSESLLEWSFTTGQPPPPVANAGLNQTVTIGSAVTLNGSASSDPSGLPLNYSWEINTRPSGSTTSLSSATAVSPTFLADAVGTYVLTLTVNNGFLDSAPSQVTVSTEAVPPTANAGPDRIINITTPTPVAMLDGSASSSPGNLPISYAWSFVSRPAGSNATLNDPTAVMPSFAIDQVGDYELQLVVNNSFFDSAPDTVRVTASNAAPTASAGLDQSANVGQNIQLNGSGSSDPNSLPLTFQWSFNTKPAESTAVLSNAAAVNPTFMLDAVGTYVLQLIVNNGFQSSAADTVSISTELLAPTANAGPDQQVPLNTLVTLNGGASADPNNLALVYNWSLIHVPDGSSASLSNAGVVSPTFTADRPGEYVAQLIVNNGTLPSAPDTVTVTTNSLPPVANAGPDQAVTAGQLVQLDGRDSSASSGLPLSYLWSLSPPGGSTAVLIDGSTATPHFTPDVPGMYVVQLIVNDTVLDSEADTVVIEAAPAGQITLSAPGVVRTYKTVNVEITLSNPAPVGGLTIGLVSTGGLTTPANVTVPEGATSASLPVQSGTQAGDFTVTGSAPGWVQDAVAITVELRPLQFVINEELIATNQTVPGRLLLDEPVPAGGVTFSVTSSNIPVASPIPTALLVAEGAIEAAVDVDGGNVGVATITATAPGYTVATDALAVTNRFVLLAEDIKVGVGQTLPFNVGISEAAPTNLTVTLTGFDPAVVTVTPTQVFIASGATQPAVQPQVTGFGFGVTTITGTAPGHITDSEVVATTLTATFSPSVASIVETNTREVTVNLSAPAPPGGLTLNLRSDDEAVATLPATVSFAPNTSTAAVVINGEAPGTTTLRAGAPNITEGTLAVTVTEAPGFNLQVETIGRDLQQQGFLALHQAAPAGNLQVTLTSDDPARLLFSLNRTGAGSASVTVQVNAGSNTPSQPVYFQALDGTGNVTYTVTAPGYKRTTGTVTFAPSGLGFVSPQQPVAIIIYSTTIQAGESQVGLQPMRLSPGTLTFAAYQGLRGGLVLPVSLQSSDPAVGTVPNSVNLDLGAASGDLNRFPFTPVAAGQTTLTVTPPPGWSVPAQYPNMVVTVTAASMRFAPLPDRQIGRDLQIAATITLDAPALAGGVTVTLQSGSPNLLLSLASGTVGSETITLTFNEGGQFSPAIYLQALGSSGFAIVTLSAPGYETNTEPFTFAPSGMVISQFFGLQNTANANTLTELNLRGLASRLDPATGATSGLQQIRGGFTVTAGLTSSQPAIGTVPAEVSFTGNGNGYGPQFVFTPLAEGSTVLTVTQPPGWQTPSNWSSLTVNVSAPGMSLFQTSFRVGRDLQFPTTVNLAAPSPTGGTTVTVSSSSPNLLLSTVRTAAGSSTITLDIQQGQTQSATFYVQSLADTGTATITFSAPRFATGSFVVNLAPSTVVFGNQGSVLNSLSLTTLSGNAVIGLATYPLISSSDLRIATNQPMEVRGGLILSASIASSQPTVGDVTTPQPLQLQASAGSLVPGLTLFNFLPASAGTTVLTVAQPPGFVNPANYNGVTITVTAPTINVGNGRWRVGSQLQRQIPVGLQVPAPPGGISITLTSGNPNLLLSTSPSTPGTNSITVTIPQGATSGGTFVVQSLAAAGQATVNVSAPGFQTTSAVFELVPSALVLQGTSFTFSGSQTSLSRQLTVQQLDPSTLNVDTDSFLNPSLRAGFAVTTDITNTNPAVATVTSPVTINGGQASGSVTITKGSPGTTVLTPVQPPGFTTPSNNVSLTVNVN